MNKAKAAFKAVRKTILTMSDMLDYDEHCEFVARVHGFVSHIEEVDREMEAEINAEITAEKAAKNKLSVS